MPRTAAAAAARDCARMSTAALPAARAEIVTSSSVSRVAPHLALTRHRSAEERVRATVRPQIVHPDRRETGGVRWNRVLDVPAVVLQLADEGALDVVHRGIDVYERIDVRRGEVELPASRIEIEIRDAVGHV